jgi:hypothetical protein
MWTEFVPMSMAAMRIQAGLFGRAQAFDIDAVRSMYTGELR